jgi:hypothetical protein
MTSKEVFWQPSNGICVWRSGRNCLRLRCQSSSPSWVGVRKERPVLGFLSSASDVRCPVGSSHSVSLGLLVCLFSS